MLLITCFDLKHVISCVILHVFRKEMTLCMVLNLWIYGFGFVNSIHILFLSSCFHLFRYNAVSFLWDVNQLVRAFTLYHVESYKNYILHYKSLINYLIGYTRKYVYCVFRNLNFWPAFLFILHIFHYSGLLTFVVLNLTVLFISFYRLHNLWWEPKIFPGYLMQRWVFGKISSSYAMINVWLHWKYLILMMNVVISHFTSSVHSL